MSDDKIKVVVPPEVLEQMEQLMEPAELEQFLAELQAMADSGQLFEQSTPVDLSTLEQDDPELFAILSEQMAEDGFTNLEDWFQHKSNPVPPTLN